MSILFFGLAGLFIFLGTYFWQIPLTFASPGSIFYYIGLVGSLILAGVLWIVRGRDLDRLIPAFAPTVIALILVVVGGLSSGGMFRSRDLARQITIPEPTAFVMTDIPLFDPLQTPWIDEGYARVLANQVFGQLGAIGSAMYVGSFYRQEVNGRLYYVTPILHDGFFSYNRNPQGTPGFIMVSLTDDNNVRLVDDNLIRIQPRGHGAWGDMLERIVFNEHPNRIQHSHHLEVDNNLVPYWIVYLTSPQVGFFGGHDVTDVAIVNATTGQIRTYDIHNVPEWVDVIFPESIIERQIDLWGLYSGGFLNAIFGQVGLIQSDEGNAMVYRDGQVYLFDSLTSRGGRDEATIGFLLTNLRTKEVRHYNLSGATEYAAMRAAEGDERVRAQGFLATFPVPVIIEGQPTYFMTLVDPSSRMVRSFALVNIQRHQVIGIGSTIREVEQNYRLNLNRLSGGQLATQATNLITIEGYVLRWGQHTISGETQYTFIIEGHENRLLTVDTSHSQATITQQGDFVRVQVMATDAYRWSVFLFENLGFEFTRGIVEEVLHQQEIDRRLEEVQANPHIFNEDRFQEFWELMSPAQREAFLAQLAEDYIYDEYDGESGSE